MDIKNKYTKMQQNHYDAQAKLWDINNRDPVVGSFDKHNAWSDYDIFLFKDIDTSGKIALDFGCGPGRNIVRFANKLLRIDGVDISSNNLENAEKWCLANKVKFTPNFYKNNGVDLSIIESDKYDIVYSTIAMQHICVYDIRFSLLKEFFRVLKPGGHICIQMGYGSRYPYSVEYHSNFYDATVTNGAMDVRIEQVEDLEEDLISIGFNNFQYNIRPVGPGDRHSNWIFYRAIKPL